MDDPVAKKFDIDAWLGRTVRSCWGRSATAKTTSHMPMSTTYTSTNSTDDPAGHDDIANTSEIHELIENLNESVETLRCEIKEIVNNSERLEAKKLQTTSLCQNTPVLHIPTLPSYDGTDTIETTEVNPDPINDSAIIFLSRFLPRSLSFSFIMSLDFLSFKLT